MLWLLLIVCALAGVSEDAVIAANTELSLEARQEAFGRLSVASVEELKRFASEEKRPLEQRWVAIRALGAHSDRGEAGAVLDTFLKSEAALVRIAAIGGIADQGDARNAGKVAAFLSDKALLVRAAAADALGQLQVPSTLPDLQRALEDPTNHYRGTSIWVRRHYVSAMATMGTAAAPYLVEVLDDVDPDVAGIARAALEQMAGFSYREGRTAAEEQEAWRRWASRY